MGKAIGECNAHWSLLRVHDLGYSRLRVVDMRKSPVVVMAYLSAHCGLAESALSDFRHNPPAPLTLDNGTGTHRPVNCQLSPLPGLSLHNRGTCFACPAAAASADERLRHE